MFELNANIGDIKRVFGIIRCSGKYANVFMSDNVLCIESARPVIRFSRACIRSCGGFTSIDGDSMFVVSADFILGVMSTGRNYETVNILYDGDNKLIIRICNVVHVVNVEAKCDIEASGVIDTCLFRATQDVRGKDFITIAKSAVDSASHNISLSTIKSVFRLSSNGGEYVSYIEAHSDTLLDYCSKLCPQYLHNLSKFVRSDDRIRLMFRDNRPVRISFDLNTWRIDYLVAPVMDND